MDELLTVVDDVNARHGCDSVTNPNTTITLQNIQHIADPDNVESSLSIDSCENLSTTNEFVMETKPSQNLDPDGELPSKKEDAGKETENQVVVTIELDAEPSIADSSEARMKQLFDWLVGQDWAEEFSADNEGIDIGVIGISTEKAKEFCRSEFGDIIDLCHFRAPSNGKFTFTSDSPNQSLIATMKPGSLVHSSSYVEAMYCGSIKGHILPETGITVDHIFQKEEDSIRFAPHRDVGRKVLGLRDLYTDPHGRKGRITADLCFLRMDTTVCRTRNEIEITDGENRLKCLPRIWKKQIKSGISVLVIDQNGHLRRGTVNKRSFVSKKCELYDTMTVVDSSGSRRITAEGDSGALVMYRDGEDDHTIHVLGVVIGKWDGVDGSSMTVANKLHDVLSAVGRHTEYCTLLAPGTEGVTEGDFMKDIEFATP